METGIVIALSAVLVVIVLFFGIVFPLWMLIHGIIRTIKLWPNEVLPNLALIALMLFFPFIGAVVYYFAVYRKTGFAPAYLPA
ncbi:hypothetical protein HYT45_04555 [Candidatus Uhrbacteria bacterium]|nr:hypothetical protein [Candidatus Uhrbacteria bacterium]